MMHGTMCLKFKDVVALLGYDMA